MSRTSLGVLMAVAMMANSAGLQIRRPDDDVATIDLHEAPPTIRVSPYADPPPPVRQNFERRQRQQIGAIGRKAAKAFRRAGRFKT